MFSREKHPSGRRCFTTATKEAFCEKYYQMGNQERAWYEVIPAKWPCHGYFDIDFKRMGDRRDVGVMYRAVGELKMFMKENLRKTFPVIEPRSIDY